MPEIQLHRASAALARTAADESSAATSHYKSIYNLDQAQCCPLGHAGACETRLTYTDRGELEALRVVGYQLRGVRG
jgi:hypothetical protein